MNRWLQYSVISTAQQEQEDKVCMEAGRRDPPGARKLGKVFDQREVLKSGLEVRAKIFPGRLENAQSSQHSFGKDKL